MKWASLYYNNGTVFGTKHTAVWVFCLHNTTHNMAQKYFFFPPQDLFFLFLTNLTGVT